jgi:hypothetical protein
MKTKFLVTAFSITLGIMAVVASAPGRSLSAQEPRDQPETPQFWEYDVSFPHPAGMRGFAKSAAEEQQLTHQSSELAHKLRDAKSEGDKDKLRTKLAETLDKQFDLRQKRHTAEIEQLEAQLKRLKDLVQKRQEARRDIIGKRLDQLQREADGLGW